MKFTLTFLIAVIATFSWSQVDFNNYTTLIAKGKIPADFSTQTKQKVADDIQTEREGLSKSEEAKFLEMIHYGIDNVLHSGLCVYGDPISTYVSDIAKKLLKDDPELFNKLRFYTIKSNVPNAFSTDQGIVFITTGLVSQFSNEAQLAFVIGHEISHYTKNHVVQTFDWNLKNHNHHDYIDQMSTYSKDKEFEADVIAVEMCHKAGYSDNEIYNSFDVLMYSYLPFDEIEMPFSYFNTDYFYAPELYFPTKKYEIKAEEDYDDAQSTHPNVRRRKDTVNVALSNFDNWGEASFVVDKARFFEIRNCARFESIRSDVLEGNYADALYSIFILEKEFPSSIYLSKMKAHSWLGLTNFKDNNRISNAIKSTSQLEGESATIHFFLKKLNRQAMTTLALRQIYDIKQLYPEDTEISMLYAKMLSNLAWKESFKPKDYSSKTFHEAANEYIARQDSINSIVAETEEEEEPIKKQTKYDRIKKKKDPNTVESFDTTKYYLYGISDIVTNEEFLASYTVEEQKFKDAEAEEDAIDKLSYREQAKIRKHQQINESKLGVNEIVVVEPTVISYNRHGVNNVKSEELEKDLEEAINYASDLVGTSTYNINKREMDAGGTDAFNERNTIMTLLQQIIVTDDNDEGVLPVDYLLLQDVKNHYGTDNILFTLVEHQYQPRLTPGGVFGMIFLPPVLPLYLIRGFFAANHTEITFIVLNTEKGTAEYANTLYQNSPVKKWNLRSQMYNILNEIHSKPQ